MTASLPMYDWPEVRAETDAYWAALGDGLRNLGLDAPVELARPIDDVWAHWRDPALAISQTCGLPYSARLAGEVSLLGAPAYAIPKTRPGFYRSEIVVRADDPAQSVDDLKGRRFAYNMRESQSGYACFLADHGDPATWFDLVETGAHRASAQAVAAGDADLACIDAASWLLFERHDPAAAKLRVLARTSPTPGLPYITAETDELTLARMRLMIETTIVTLPKAITGALFLTGFAKLRPSDYAPLAAGWPDA